MGADESAGRTSFQFRDEKAETLVRALVRKNSERLNMASGGSAPSLPSVDSNTRRNVITYYINFVVVAAVGFVVNPLLLGALGPVMFGVWKSLQRYLDFATVADGRASQALKWIVASRTGHTDEEKRRDVGAAAIVWLRWLPAAIAVAIGVTIAVPLLIKGIPPDLHFVAYATAAILAANTVLAGLLSLPDSVLSGVNQGYKSMAVTTLAFIASNVFMVVAVYCGWPIWSLALIVLLAAMVNAWVTLFVTRRSVPWWGISRPSKDDMSRVLGYSAWTLGWVVVEKLFISSELIIISIMAGAIVVTQYTFTTYVMQFILSITLMSASAFMPILGSQLGGGDIESAANRAAAVRQFVVGIAVLGSAGILAFNGFFVTLWAGDDQYLGTTVNALLVVCGLQLALIRMDGQILDVTMRIAPKVLVGLISSVGGIVGGCLAYGATHDLRIALAAVSSLRLIGTITYPILVHRSIPGSGLRWNLAILSLILLSVSLAIGPAIQSGNALSRIVCTFVWISVAGVVAWLGLVPRAMVKAIIAKNETH